MGSSEADAGERVCLGVMQRLEIMEETCCDIRLREHAMFARTRVRRLLSILPVMTLAEAAETMSHPPCRGPHRRPLDTCRPCGRGVNPCGAWLLGALLPCLLD